MTTRRDRQFVYYAVTDDHTTALLADALGLPRPAASSRQPV